ncbi:MAG: RNA polymerase sigma factor, partial [Planctomycetota bacterium]
MKANEPDAWCRLAGLYGPLVYHWCRQSGLKGEEAADVVQEVFAAVATGVADFRGEQPKGSFRAWLRTIARNKVSDHFRRRQGQVEAKGGSTAQQRLLEIPQPTELSDEVSSPEAENALWRRAVEFVRAEFEDRTWEAFWQVTVGRRVPAEVADNLGMTVDAVYQAKSRVLRRLRQELSEL